jgi:hypothetical protein
VSKRSLLANLPFAIVGAGGFYLDGQTIGPLLLWGMACYALGQFRARTTTQGAPDAR